MNDLNGSSDFDGGLRFACDCVLGLGHDVVALDGFARQLADPDGGMRRLFSARELRQCALRGRIKADGEAVHLAARWAGKEAVIKAWCEALGECDGSSSGSGSSSSSGPSGSSLPYTLDTTPWGSIEILDDAHGIPHVVFDDDVAASLSDSLRSSGCCGSHSVAADWRWHISLSHDGPVASAVAILVVDAAGA